MPIEIYVVLLELLGKFVQPFIAQQFLDELDARLTIRFTDEQIATLDANGARLVALRENARRRSEAPDADPPA